MPGKTGTRSELMRRQTMNLRKIGSAFLLRPLLASGSSELDTKLQFALLTFGHALDTVRPQSGASSA
jgi:hypothetical protein